MPLCYTILGVKNPTIQCKGWWAMPTLRYVKGCGDSKMQIFSAILLRWGRKPCAPMFGCIVSSWEPL